MRSRADIQEEIVATRLEERWVKLTELTFEAAKIAGPGTVATLTITREKSGFLLEEHKAWNIPGEDNNES